MKIECDKRTDLIINLLNYSQTIKNHHFLAYHGYLVGDF